MLIRSGFEIDVNCAVPVPMMLALSTHSALEGRMVGEDHVRMSGASPGQRPEQRPEQRYVDGFGNRITRIVAPTGQTRLWSDFVMEVDGAPDAYAPEARQHEVQDLPDDVLRYLVASRYCDSDNLIPQAWSLFGNGPRGWARVQAITQFVHDHVTFGYQFGRPNKTASEVYNDRTGVCRDFAHLAISLCRAMNIPARYASGYLGDIGVPYAGPGDFCAWFEVYLGGRWYTFDARYNTPRMGRILMVRGADAADVAMITSFGGYALTYFKVWSEQLEDGLDDATIRGMLQTRPAGEALVYPSPARTA